MKKSTKIGIGVGIAAGVSAGVVAGGMLYLYDLMLKPEQDKRFPFRKKKTKEVEKQFEGAISQVKQWILEHAQWMEEVGITSFDGLHLYGRYIACPDSTKTVIFMHGYRSTAEHDFTKAIPDFYNHGYNVLLVDERSQGKSEGSYMGYGVLERQDLRDWMLYLNEHYPDTKNIVAYGVSMGAATVMMATGLPLPKNVSALIADCGFTSPWDIFLKIKTKDMHTPEGILLKIYDKICKKRAGFGFKDVYTTDCMEKNQIPMIFIHGDADTFVPKEMTIENYRACSAPKRLIFVKGAPHGASYLSDPKGCGRKIFSFLRKYEK